MPQKATKTLPERPKAKAKRVPNVERTAATRAKLLNATIECLAELGYHQTSTVVVTERAKVSRGAMLHHFPTKADLMMAASEYIVELRREIHGDRLPKLQSDRERFLHLIDVLWDAFDTPSGIARIEIMLGSRCDPELGPRFRALNDDLEQRHKEKVWKRAQSIGVKDRKTIVAFVQLYAAAVRGLVIDRLSTGAKSDIKAAVALLKEFQLQMLEKLLADAKKQGG